VSASTEQRAERGASESLLPSCSIDALLASREAMRERLERIEALEEEIRDIARAAAVAQNDPGGGPLPQLYLHFEERERTRFSMRAAMERADRCAWGWFMQRSGLYQFLDAQAREEWDRQVRGEKGTYPLKSTAPLPDLTRDNIEATFQGIHAQRADFLARGVLNLFQRLSSRHKTNSAKVFTPKIIRAGAFDRWAGSDSVSSSYHFSNELDDLERFLRILRKIPEAADAERAYQRLKPLNVREVREVAFPWFVVRGHLNGTAHILFKYEEDVARLNAMLSRASGGAAIPAERRGRHAW
jgi:hypothetical protein